MFCHKYVENRTEGALPDRAQSSELFCIFSSISVDSVRPTNQSENHSVRRENASGRAGQGVGVPPLQSSPFRPIFTPYNCLGVYICCT